MNMNKILIFLLGIISIVFIFDRVIALSVDYFLPEVKYGQKVGEINYFLSKEEKTDLLVLGSSRARNHVIPDSFESKVFILAHDGMYFSFNLGVTAILSNQKKLPKTILFHIEPYFFGRNINSNEETFFEQIHHLKSFYNKDKLITKYINRTSRRDKLKYLFHTYKFNGALPSLLINYIKSKLNPPDYNGFEAIPYNPSAPTFVVNKKIINEEKLLRQLSSLDSKKELSVFEYFEDLFTLVDATDSEIIFFTAPVYPTYKDMLGNPDLGRIIKSYLNKKGKIYLNYIDDINLSELENKKYWRDPNHLNIEGARIFTSDLKKQFENLH